MRKGYTKIGVWILLMMIGMTLLPLFGTKADELAESECGGQEYLDRISFFGDSTTYGMLRYIVRNDGTLGKHNYTLREDQILTPACGTFYLKNLGSCTIRYKGQDYPLSEGLKEANPEILVLTAGINGMRTWEEEDFKRYYSRLIEIAVSALPDSRIILQSVYPTSERPGTVSAEYTNGRIDRVNGWIMELSEQYGLPFLNTASALKDASGRLPECRQNGDGIHLNTEGFNVVLDYICNHMLPERKEEI
ncbi:MAG: SGNH/GDSL hydrolase family protein [Eubacteriales bacterium]